jgi:hypothetical protein
VKSQTNLVTYPDGVQIEVVTDMRDWVAFDLVRRARGWPEIKEAPILHRSFLIWNAQKRNGAEVGVKFDPALHTPAEVEIDDDEDPTSATDSG